MTKDEIIEMARQAGFRVGPSRDGPDDVWGVVADLDRLAKLIAEKERASNHAYIYELERDLEVAQDKINDCLVCLNFNPLEAAQDKIKGCLGILNYNPRGKND